MSILTTVFVDTPGDVARFAEDGPPDGHPDTVVFGGLTNLEFETLWAIVGKEEFDPERHALVSLFLGSDGSPWLWRFPDAFITTFGQLDASQVANAAKAWVATEELSGSEPSEAEPVIKDVARMSRVARESGRALFLWGSL
jgi:hypothetical protein